MCAHHRALRQDFPRSGLDRQPHPHGPGVSRSWCSVPHGLVRIGQLTLTVRPSIGIALCPDEGATVDSLIKRADIAMYRAKRQQTGHAFFDQREDG